MGKLVDALGQSGGICDLPIPSPDLHLRRGADSRTNMPTLAVKIAFGQLCLRAARHKSGRVRPWSFAACPQDRPYSLARSIVPCVRPG